jgi:hypothetical protein
MDLLVRVQGGRAHGSTLRLKDLVPEETTVSDLRKLITTQLGRDDVDLTAENGLGGRLFLAGFSLLDDNATLEQVLGHGVTGQSENKEEAGTPTLNVVPVYKAKISPLQQAALDKLHAQQQQEKTESDGKGESGDAEDEEEEEGDAAHVQNVLMGMLNSLYKQRAAHKKSYADLMLRSSVEMAEVRLANGRTWIVNGFKNGDVTLPPAHSQDSFLPLKHAVEINNIQNTTVRVEKCVHLNIVNARKS